MTVVTAAPNTGNDFSRPKLSPLLMVGTILSSLIFLVALTQDGIYLQQDNPRAWAPGWGELLLGWFTVPDGTLAWLANPFYFCALLAALNGHRGHATILSVIAIALAVSIFITPSILSNEAGGHAKISGFGWGCYFWISSMVVLLSATVADGILASLFPAEQDHIGSAAIE